MSATELEIATAHGPVEGLLLQPGETLALHVFAHGAGAGMRHAFMEFAATAMARRGIATLRYEFPYMAAGRSMPDRAPVLVDTVRAAVETAREHAEGSPMFAGGKSLGGRMTSTAAAETPLPGIRGLIFHGFPLHRPGNPSDARADHLDDVHLPMLFLQGTRDRLASLPRISRVCDRLGTRASLHVVHEADHGFGVPKRAGRSEQDVHAELADSVARWMTGAIEAS